MRPLFILEYTSGIYFCVINLTVLLTAVLGFRDMNYRDNIPRPRFLTGDSNVTFHVGATATLRCGVIDLGTKTVTWKKAGSLEPLTIGEMSFAQRTDYEVHHMDPHWNLLIKNVQLEHAGIYECHVSTKDKMKRVVQLNVVESDGKSEPLINISGLLHVDKGHSINLVCNASGTTAPPELMQWFKDGLEVMASSRVLIREQYSVTSRTITSWLEIKQAQLEDKGTYTCRASDLQVTSVDVNVLNAEKPNRKEREEESPQASIVDSRSSSSSRLYCSYSAIVLYVLVLHLISYIHRR